MASMHHIAGDHKDRPDAAMQCIDAIADVVVTNGLTKRQSMSC